MRLMGAGAVLRKALEDFAALPEDAPERKVALPALFELRSVLIKHPSPEGLEFLMSTQNVYQEWRTQTLQEGIQQGIKQGIEQGIEQGEERGHMEERRALVLRLLTRRFGPLSEGVVQRVESAEYERLGALLDALFSEDSLEALLQQIG